MKFEQDAVLDKMETVAGAPPSHAFQTTGLLLRQFNRGGTPIHVCCVHSLEIPTDSLSGTVVVMGSNEKSKTINTFEASVNGGKSMIWWRGLTPSDVYFPFRPM